MREYKFRGKRIDNGEWVYGNLIIDDGKYYICLGINEHIKRDDYEVYMIEVIPETVGQYTGLKEIYEGDIVKYTLQNHKSGEIYFENFVVGWNEETASYIIKNNTKGALCIDYVQKNGEVIGNIWEDSNLLNDSKSTEKN